MTDSKPANNDKPANAERVAVVFVHGQGKQTPMTDVADLAESVWRTDPDSGPGLTPVYSVPVYDEDASALRRIITQAVKFPGGQSIDGHDGIQVEFFQFYWADLMQGNRFAQLWVWFGCLIRKNPEENIVPPTLKPLRVLTLGVCWLVAPWAVALGLAAEAELVTARELAGFFGCWAITLIVLAVLIVGRARTSRPPKTPRCAEKMFKTIDAFKSAYGAVPIVLGLLATSLAVLLSLFTGGLFAATSFSILLIPPISLTACFLTNRATLDRAFMLGLFTIALCLVAGPLGLLAIGDRSWLQSLLSTKSGAHQVAAALRILLWTTAVPCLVVGVLGWMLSRSFLIPVMTESARLFTPSPDNVGNQDRIRARGLELFERLHRGTYDRIVVLAHSLGAVVAYDTLTYYWGKVNGAFTPAAAFRLGQALATVEDAARRLDTAKDEGQALLDYRAAVRAFGRRVRSSEDAKGRRRWRISDFITIGSPLTYGPFLLEPTDNEFIDQALDYRRYALCPPPRAPGGENRFTFVDENKIEQPHHAATFAGVCWTNLYFPSLGLVWGDLIGGETAGELGNKLPDPDGRPLARRGLGLGILDRAVDHDPHLGSFSHNDYWPWPDYLRDARGVPASGAPQFDRFKSPPDHIEKLRLAFHFFQDAGSADQALRPPGARRAG